MVAQVQAKTAPTCFLTSDISFFGVGSKNACFYLGSSTKVGCIACSLQSRGWGSRKKTAIGRKRVRLMIYYAQDPRSCNSPLRPRPGARKALHPHTFNYTERIPEQTNSACPI